ncbi:hypothetical protein OROGR_002916 [Orobanche gracilis]
MKFHGAGKTRLFLLVIVFMLSLSADAQTTSFFINCGTNSSVNVEGRRWVGDTSPGNNVTLGSPGIEAFNTLSHGDPIYEPLYRSGRIFTDSLNYTFRVPNGFYFLRLHFSPLAFDGYNANDSYFSVEANGLKLVLEFNVPDEISEKNLHLLGSGADNSSHKSISKEYFFSVDTNLIVVEFVPSRGSFGFVNAIEIVPGGNSLFVDMVGSVGSDSGNSSLNLRERGMETMYRLNVGGLPVEPSRDSLWRKWEADSSYMINLDAGLEIRNGSNITYADPKGTGIAPLAVYESARTLANTGVLENRFNMSWKLEVDPDFDYLVRLHYCELVYDRPNQRIFRVYIDNKTAADSFDVYVRAGGMNRAYHEDRVDSISSKSNTLWIQLGPGTTTGSTGSDALLNGLEVFKLSRNGNLAYVQAYSNVKAKKASRSLILWLAIGAGVASIVILAGVCMLIARFRKKKTKESNNIKKTPPSWRPLFLRGSTVSSTTNAKVNMNGQISTLGSGRRFTLNEIKSATNCFDESLVIGEGGFGKVYKAEVDESTLVAVKRSNPQSRQGLAEFETEIEMLSVLRHRHLVSLIGFCDEHNEMILVYEYMGNGTLRSHLFGSDLPPLSWKQRLEICIGAARGLHYLHTGSDRGIIHRDVKTTNILLDESFVAKVSDFGLSKTGPSLEHTHVSTAVKGSFGYLDPEYFRRRQLTEKSDVYSFGVVLLEVVCARAVINPTLPIDEISLAEWAMRWQRKKSIESILDPRLGGVYCPESLARFGDIAEKCLADEGKSRPTMGEVLWRLEYVLQLHEAWLRSEEGDDSCLEVWELGSVEEGECEVSMGGTAGSDVKDKEDGQVFSGMGKFLQMGNQQER